MRGYHKSQERYALPFVNSANSKTQEVTLNQSHPIRQVQEATKGHLLPSFVDETVLVFCICIKFLMYVTFLFYYLQLDLFRLSSYFGLFKDMPTFVGWLVGWLVCWLGFMAYQPLLVI